MVDITHIDDLRRRRQKAEPASPPPEDPSIERSRYTQELLRQTHHLIEFVGSEEAVRITREAFRVALRALRADRAREKTPA